MAERLIAISIVAQDDRHCSDDCPFRTPDHCDLFGELKWDNRKRTHGNLRPLGCRQAEEQQKGQLDVPLSPDPLRDVLKAMTGHEPPDFVRGYDTQGLSDAQQQALQDWASMHVRPSWLTGIGLLDAAETQVQEAVWNANIPPKGK